MTLDEKEKFLRGLNANDFLTLGAPHIAYVREVEFMGQTHYSIHSADGKALTLATSHDLAMSVIDKADMEAVVVH